LSFFFQNTHPRKKAANAIKENTIVVAANGCENSIPAYLFKSFSISIPTQPDEYWFSDNVISGKTPIIFRVVRFDIINSILF
jgi:hypothetical protein